MQYKSISLELLQQRPKLHDQLRKKRKLLTVLNSLARELKNRHEAWRENLSGSKPHIDPSQIPSAAMEIALQEMEDRLRSAFPSDDQEPLSLDAGVAFIRNLTLRD